MDNNRVTGLVSIFNGNVSMGASAFIAFRMFQDLYSGGGLAGAIPPLVMGALLYSVGHAQKIFGVDLVHRREDDFSPPDPMIKDAPVLGRFFYRLAEREIEKTEREWQSRKDAEKSNRSGPSL
ncbi:MAG: hypothetical protein H6862_03205 [Rhodospirillales bacterium]|nr:hypothetical protein [Rhodospirillales bacterium]